MSQIDHNNLKSKHFKIKKDTLPHTAPLQRAVRAVKQRIFSKHHDSTVITPKAAAISRWRKKNTPMVLFIGNVSKKTTEGDLLKLLAGYGVITKLKLMADHITRRSRGYAYVDMEQNTDAENVIEKLNTLIFMGSCLIIGKATKYQVATDWK